MLVAAAFVGLAWAFIAVRVAFLTLFLALFSALVLDPVVAIVQRRLKRGRSSAAVIVVLSIVAFALLAAFVLVSPFVNSMRDFVDALPAIMKEIRESSVGSWVGSHSQAPEQAQEHVKQVAQGIGQAAGGVLGFAVSAFSLILSLVTAVFLTLFLIIDLPRLVAAVDSLLDPSRSARLQRGPAAGRAGDRHRGLAHDARQHRDLRRVRNDLRPVGVGARPAVSARVGLHRR